MYTHTCSQGCGQLDHLNRRTLLKAAGLSGISWLTPLATHLARAQEAASKGTPARSVIVLWLAGGPSQLETFDPHPDAVIAGGTKAIETNVAGIQFADGFEQLAEQMDSLAIVRSVVSKEGDHERATYNVKTGYRPDPTLVHPAIGAIVSHQLTDEVEIPRHISILPGPWPARGGYLGDQFDAFQIDDPRNRIPDVQPRVEKERFDRRVADLQTVEAAFARRRLRTLDGGKTLHGLSTRGALKMMSSEQLGAFDVSTETESVRKEYGDSPFGRGCLAAARLIEVGVRCVEVTLNGWDSHANNHETQRARVQTLDPAFSALIRDLKRRGLFEKTIIVCGGEFGRTPTINPLQGRDHWPHGFSVALAGGGLRGGVVVGATAPEPKLDEKDHLQDVERPVHVADLHATVLHALGIQHDRELLTPIGRPMKLTDGKVIEELV